MDTLSFELPKAVARFSSASKRCISVSEGIIDRFVVSCSPHNMISILCEVERVPELIHQTKVSWDATLDPESYFKIGQVVEAKVHLLDFSLERIFLSLKEIVPDPLIEALEAVIGDHESLGRELAAEADTKVASPLSMDAPPKSPGTTDHGLMKKLKGFDGLAMSIGNGIADSNDGGTNPGIRALGVQEWHTQRMDSALAGRPSSCSTAT